MRTTRRTWLSLILAGVTVTFPCPAFAQESQNRTEPAPASPPQPSAIAVEPIPSTEQQPAPIAAPLVGEFQPVPLPYVALPEQPAQASPAPSESGEFGSWVEPGPAYWWSYERDPYRPQRLPGNRLGGTRLTPNRFGDNPYGGARLTPNRFGGRSLGGEKLAPQRFGGNRLGDNPLAPRRFGDATRTLR
jgi:hypothetical protein